MPGQWYCWSYFEGFFADLNARAAVLAAELGEEFAGQERDVLLAFAQWRHEEGNHIESVEEVFAEISLGDFLFQVFVRGSDETHVYAQRLCAANRRKQLVVESTEHLGLRLETHVADLVEVQGTAVGAFEGSALL